MDGFGGQFYLVHPDGTGLTQITHFTGNPLVKSASFSPDGRSIVFAKKGATGQAHLYEMNADGSNIHSLPRPPLWDSAPDWGTN